MKKTIVLLFMACFIALGAVSNATGAKLIKGVESNINIDKTDNLNNTTTRVITDKNELTQLFNDNNMTDVDVDKVTEAYVIELNYELQLEDALEFSVIGDGTVTKAGVISSLYIDASKTKVTRDQHTIADRVIIQEDPYLKEYNTTYGITMNEALYEQLPASEFQSKLGYSKTHTLPVSYSRLFENMIDHEIVAHVIFDQFQVTIYNNLLLYSILYGTDVILVPTSFIVYVA